MSAWHLLIENELDLRVRAEDSARASYAHHVQALDRVKQLKLELKLELDT